MKKILFCLSLFCTVPLMALDENICLLKGRCIILENKNLSSFPKEVLNPQVESLNLKGNHLTLLPDGIKNCAQSLKSLVLSDNELISLNNIEYLTNLTHLYLRNNLISEVPETISKLENLIFLDISDNEYLNSLPKSLLKLTNLKTLSAQACTFNKETKKLLEQLKAKGVSVSY